MRKVLIYIVVSLLLVVMAAFVSLRFFPQIYVSAFNKFSSQQTLSTQGLSIQFFPLSLSVKELGVKNEDGSTLLTLSEANASAQLIGWLRGKNNFWKADLSKANFSLHKLPATASKPKSNDVGDEADKINVHEILSALSLNIEDLVVNLDEQQSIRVERLKTSLNDHELFDFANVEQNITFSLIYQNQEISVNQELALSGSISSSQQSGFSVVDISVPVVDLSIFNSNPVVSSSEQVPAIENDAEPTTVEKKLKEVIESSIDWQWLNLFDPVQANISIQQVTWSKSLFENTKLGLTLNNSIEFSLNSEVAWLESDDFSFKDNIQLGGQWKPIAQKTQGADLTGELALSTSITQVNVNGDVNLNGLNANKLSVVIQSASLPVSLGLAEETQSIMKQYFPIKTLFSFAQDELNSMIDIQEATFGKSDLSGVVNLKPVINGYDITAQLESALLSYQSIKVDIDDDEKVESNLQPLLEVRDGETSEVSVDDGQLSSKKVFSDETIDWSWLDSLLISFDFNAKQILFDGIEINDLQFPLSVVDGKLNISDLSGKLGGGQFSANTSVVKKDEGVDVDFRFDALEVVLEQLKLLPPEELQKAITDLSVKVKTSGQSSSQLAQSLNGSVRMLVGDGVIGNNSFELIGSDLILSLLNKLNPFAKKDKTTDLECVVVNLNIDNGKVDVDQSIALRTSKLTMVADGHIDLSSEKIKLNLTPKARQGVGVDVSSLVKFVALGGTLSKPSPTVTASGVLKSAVVVGAAVSTGGVSLLATSAAEKTIANVDVCERADNAFRQ